MKNLEKVQQTENSFSLSIGDLMAALLLIFILLLSATLLKLEEQHASRNEIVEVYHKLQEELYKDLQNEFSDDLIKWSAILDRNTLSIRFKEPDVLFDGLDDTVKEKFKAILDDFFPRYINLISNVKYKSSIEEIRIEGHTSSEWYGEVDPVTAYFNNMELSQNRTRSVLEHCVSTIDNEILQKWTFSKITANGLSSSKTLNLDGEIIEGDGENESKILSRRVEFRIRTNAEERMNELLKEIQ